MTVAVHLSEARVERAASPLSTWRSLAMVVRLGLRGQRRAPFIWGGALGVMGALMAALWPSIEDSMDDLMRTYPEDLKNALGIQQLDSVEKYIEVEMLSFIVPLAAAYFGIRSAIRLTVMAEDRGYLDTLLALPLSRRVLVLGSYVATGLVTAAILVVAAALTWLGGTVAGTGISAAALASGFGNVWPLAMVFAGVAVLMAGRIRRPAVVTGVAMVAAVGMYIVDLLGKVAPAMQDASALSVFRYYGSAIQDGVDLSHAAALTIVGALLAVTGALSFDRRDLG